MMSWEVKFRLQRCSDRIPQCAANPWHSLPAKGQPLPTSGTNSAASPNPTQP